MLSLTERVASVDENLAMAIVQDPIVVLPETTLGEAIVLMSQARSFCAADSDLLPHTSVVQSEARSSCVLIQEEQKVIGILTERDVVCLCSQGSQVFNQTPVNQVMTTPVRTLRQSEFANLYSAISVLQKHHIRHLPLVDEEGNVLGLLTHETLRQLLQPTDLLRLRLVQEVMVPVVITAEPTESLLTVVQRLARHRVSCVVVAEERPTAAGSLRIPIGIVTERDIVQFKALELDFQGYTVAQVMSAPVVTIAETESLVTVHELMEQSFIRRVVVTGKEGELRGIVTQSNVLQLLSPLELYKLTVVLETKVKNLEAEKVALLKNRNLQLEVEINARMAELQKQVKREQIITTLASQIRSSLSLPKILEMAVEEIRQIIGCDRVNIWKCEPERSIVVVAESTSLERSLMGERIQDHCWEIHFAAGDQPDPVSDVYSAEMTDDCRALLIRLQIRATVLVPILYGDQLWGVLSIVETETPRNWEPEEVDLVQNLATHVAIAIQQASRHEQLKIELQEREKIEAELRNITQHLEAAHRIASLGTWELDPHSNRVYWSQEVFRIFEVDPQTFEASYEAFLRLVHPDDRDEVNTIYQEHLSGHRSYEMVHRLLLPDGRIKYVYEQCETTCSEDGTPLISRGTVQDITRQKEAELEQRRIAQEVVTLNAELEQRVLERTAELTEREATLADFVNNANDLIQIVELDTGKFEFVNQAWQQILGYTVAELNGLTIFKILAPDCQIAFQTLVDQMATGKVTDVEQMELTLIAKSGQAIVVQGNINCRCKTDEEGHERPCSVRAILRDITAKKAAEIALQASEAKYRQIVETAHEGIWMIDADAKHQFANAALLQMLGYTRAEMEGRSLFDFVSPEFHSDLQSLLKRRSEGVAETNEVPLVRKDGSTLWVLSTGSPIFSKAGQYVGAMAMVTDITQRRQAEDERQRLLQELSGFKLGLDESAIVAITDPQGVILYTNQRFIDISGYSEAELLGQTHRLVNSGIHPPAFFQDLWRTIRKGEVWRGEICNRAKEGPLYWVDSTIVPFLNAQGKPDRYLAVRFDITQRKQAQQLLQEKLELLREVTAAQSQFITAQNRLEIFERLLATVLETQNLLTQRNEELAVSNIELERATRLKDEFLANMSHELRTPLNSILGMGEALQEEVFGILNEKQLKALRTVEKSASHLLTLINDILDVAKIESGEVKLEYSYVSVEQLCSSSLAFIKQHALKKRIQLQTEISSGLPAVFVDEVRMRQVLLNLLTNAVKFTLEGGTVTLAAFLVPQEDHKQVLRLSIKDTGIGISPENLDRLFKPFVQIDGALNRQQMGTGLGLTLVKQLVELHGGKVHLSSELGVGSCFTIDLPAGSTFSSEPSAEEPPAQTNPLPAPDQETSQKSLILLAEDDLANIETIACYLEAKGYAMVFANDGQEAIDLVQKNLPDLILMDIQMPGMDGLEAIGLIRQMERLQNIPIIALTALAMKGDQERCLDAGANLYLSKPVKLKQLDTAIKALLKDA